ncbi:hypothetical protein Pmar_PMAR027629 [Perkinsus marinus ATCC 50983]|uniref:LicD/FKTN/FKRP nucleotidyltransferase domain-containing protein n=2 Tax=Perkinsus marinus (strain ATCC 50983 / TXsc) TaxID=423536 RepID=C5KCA0_PERM5|nr:hypothetical protein Pmar_PMAR027629 [Perkinsus marinus ATCC 50983]EER17913.1 hypothetical protein Pmar_PMAR027629 [Perkinsus marinus ATCC 50983]|eukprot:XP_002786117.1 hypothetical protein Pmar_PMAR027629 [Perkinsus marinus ATCC 50983]
MHLLLPIALLHAIRSIRSAKSRIGHHPFIRVMADATPKTAALDNIFLCPSTLKDEVDLSDWPKSEVFINGTPCMNHEEILAMENRAEFIECMAEVVNTTTHTLHALGIDASLSDGSLLGWYRHSKTFIPWDVDADMTLLKEECRDSFEEYASPKQKNMAQVIQSRLPSQNYRATAVKSGVGSEIKDETWEGCDADELRVVHKIGKVACHVDLFFLYRSNDPTAPCKCPGNSDGSQLCGKFGKLCGNYGDLYPAKWDVQEGADCKVPRKPVVSLQLKYGRPGMPGITFTNMKKVPMNYKFGKAWMVVIGSAAEATESALPGNASKQAPQSQFRGSSDGGSAADPTREFPTSKLKVSGSPIDVKQSNKGASLPKTTSPSSDVETTLQNIIATTTDELVHPDVANLNVIGETANQQSVGKPATTSVEESSAAPILHNDDLIMIPEIEERQKTKEVGIKPFARTRVLPPRFSMNHAIDEEAEELNSTAEDYRYSDNGVVKCIKFKGATCVFLACYHA